MPTVLMLTRPQGTGTARPNPKPWAARPKILWDLTYLSTTRMTLQNACILCTCDLNPWARDLGQVVRYMTVLCKFSAEDNKSVYSCSFIQKWQTSVGSFQFTNYRSNGWRKALKDFFMFTASNNKLEEAAQGKPSAKYRPTHVVVDAALRRIRKSRHGGHKFANISVNCQRI